MTKSVSLPKTTPDSAPYTAHPRFTVFTERQFDQIAPLTRLSAEHRFAMRVVANVHPFRVNGYVVDQLIDWDDIPDDPIFQLTFPQPGMLSETQFEHMATTLRATEDKRRIREVAAGIRAELNPHPAGQRELNVPRFDDHRLEGLQHKYRETVLFFPSQGQTCHAYCTFCFRWARFVGDKELRFAANEAGKLHHYLRHHPEVSDLPLTGGDPMVMKTRHLSAYLEPLQAPEFAHVSTIPIGTRAISFWPQRLVADADADDLLRLLEKLSAAGKQVAIIAHFNHWRELETGIAREAVRRLRDSGAVIRSLSPLLGHINDTPDVWAQLWRTQSHLGIYPYYMSMARDTGARHYFEVPLARALEIYRGALQQVPGLGRTARGPSMSAGPGKVEVQGVTEIQGEKVFVLRFLQGRNPDWVQRPFLPASIRRRVGWTTWNRPRAKSSSSFNASTTRCVGQREWRSPTRRRTVAGRSRQDAYAAGHRSPQRPPRHLRRGAFRLLSGRPGPPRRGALQRRLASARFRRRPTVHQPHR